MPQIHETAIVHPKAELGNGVKVGPYAVIGKHVVLGDNCEVGSHVVIEGRTKMGKGNRIFTGAVIGSEPQDLKYKGEVSYLEIGDDNIFREFVDINGHISTLLASICQEVFTTTAGIAVKIK